MTRTPRMTGVSRFPSRPRSVSTFAITPDDETQVTPASATAPSGPHPSSRAATAPGVALSAKSTAPDGYCVLRLVTSSEALYSRPSRSSSRMTPISAPTAVNSSLAPSGSSPPSPKASPASR